MVAAPGQALVSLFCYEPRALPQLLEGVVRSGALLLVTAGRATAAVQQALAPWGPGPRPGVRFLPWMSQPDFDHLLWSCDLNFVRGEDSLVRALWAGRPFVWQLYPQDDGAHAIKLEAFLQALALPPALADWHRRWNSTHAAPGAGMDRAHGPLAPPMPAFPLLNSLNSLTSLTQENHDRGGASGRDGEDAARWAQQARAALCAQPDLVTQLCRFVEACGQDLKTG